MNQNLVQDVGSEAKGKTRKTSENLTSPMLKKKVSKNRMPLGGFYTPGNLKNHHYFNKQKNSGTNRDYDRLVFLHFF